MALIIYAGGELPLPVAIPVLTLPTVGGVIGFNRTRRYDAPPVSGDAVIQIKNDRVRFAFPRVYLKPNPFISGDFVKTVDVVQLHF